MNYKRHTKIRGFAVHLRYVEGISWVLLYCLLYSYLSNIQVYDKISPVLFLTIQKSFLCK